MLNTSEAIALIEVAEAAHAAPINCGCSRCARLADALARFDFGDDR